jgi:hypothetical protein
VEKDRHCIAISIAQGGVAVDIDRSKGDPEAL